MKLELQLTSLEQSKRLKELGVEAESYFVWTGNELFGYVIKDYDNRFRWRGAKSIPAYSIAELLEILGDDLDVLEPQGKGSFIASSWWDSWDGEYRNTSTGTAISALTNLLIQIKEKDE